jgi:hypothetical protein
LPSYKANHWDDSPTSARCSCPSEIVL